jgi:hypothetical protein
VKVGIRFEFTRYDVVNLSLRAHPLSFLIRPPKKRAPHPAYTERTGCGAKVLNEKVDIRD